MILQLDHAESTGRINEIIDDARFTAILNSSSWPLTKCINTTTKNDFLQCLIFGEVIQKRQPAIWAFCRGLDLLSLHKLLKENTNVMRPAFLYDESKLVTAYTFIGLICMPRSSDEAKAMIYDWFIEYLWEDSCREASLEQVLQLCTGLKCVPPIGLKDQVTYLFTSPLPMAEACFSTILLPVVHTKAFFFNPLQP